MVSSRYTVRRTKRKQYRLYKPFVSTAVRKYVKYQLDRNIEDKYYNINLATSSLSSIGSAAWTELNLCAPPQGDDVSDRSGRRIRVKSIEIKGVLVGGVTQTLLDDQYNILRGVIAVWRSNNDTPMEVPTSITMNNPIKRDTVAGGTYIMRKLYDQYITLEVTSTEKTEGDGYSAKPLKFTYYKRFKKPLLINYGDSSLTYPSMRLILGMRSDSAAVPNPGFVNGYSIVRYEDA